MRLDPHFSHTYQQIAVGQHKNNSRSGTKKKKSIRNSQEPSDFTFSNIQKYIFQHHQNKM